MRDSDEILYVDLTTTPQEVREATHVHNKINGVERCVKRRALTEPCIADPAAPESPLIKQMEAVEEMREGINALVAALVDDGFSHDQARDIVAGMWRTAERDSDG